MMRNRKTRSRYSVTPAQVLLGYRHGLFPMARGRNGEIEWFMADPRTIIPLDDRFHVSKSLRKTIKQKPFDIRFNSNFAGVIAACAQETSDRPSTWINETIKSLYTALHHMGHAHSVEAWDGDELVGGLYGVSLGSAFFGESMFSRRTDASKICLVHLVARLRQQHFTLLDTQFTTEHLKPFGAIDVPKADYALLLAAAMESPHLKF